MARAAKFQRTFSVYFPHFSDDWVAAAFEMEWIWYGFRNNSLGTVRPQKAKRELEKLLGILRYLGTCEVPYWQGVSSDIRDEEIAEETAGSGGYYSVAEYQSEILDFLLSLGEMNKEGLTEKVLGGFAEKATREIERLPERRNINWDAVHAVDRLRTLWWRNTGNDAPSRALNPASTFCRFLGDGLDFLEIDADPVSAFKRWADAYPYK